MGEATTIVVQCAAFVVAVGILARAVIGMHRAARRIEDTFELVRRELMPNGGSSVYDAIKRIDDRVQVLEVMERRHDERRSDDHANP